MRRVGSFFYPAAKRFIEPLSTRGRAFVTLGTTAVIAVVVHALLVGLIVLNCTSTSLLAMEMMRESGPDFADARRIHARMLSEYVDRLRGGVLPLLLDALYPEYSPKRRLEPLALSLGKESGDEERDRQAIRSAGEEITNLCRGTQEFLDKEIKWIRSARMPPSFLRAVNDALDKSDSRVDILANDPGVENARLACMANREAVLLVFLAKVRYNYSDRGSIERLLITVDRARNHTNVLADTMKDDATMHALLLRWVENEQSRKDILAALSDNDMDKVRQLLRCEIEKAHSEEGV